jgi:hypothetical protein
MYRKYINIVEAANKGCPIATHDIDVNLKNRQTAIDEYHYGPANPEEPSTYWKDAGNRWNISEKTAKTMLCGNCAAFDVSVGQNTGRSQRHCDTDYGCNFKQRRRAGSNWLAGNYLKFIENIKVTILGNQTLCLGICNQF